MRVLHLFDWYLPSTLSWVSRLLLHLPEVEVSVGAPWMVQNQFCHPQFKYYRFPLQAPGIFDPVSEMQFPFWRWMLTRSQRFLPTYPLWLGWHLRHNPPDILHAHFGPTGCLYLPPAKKLNRPLVVTFYGFDYQKLLHHRPVFRKKYQELFAQAARVVAASPIRQRELEAMGCPSEKIALVRPSPDLAQFPLAKRIKQPGRLHLVQVATFTPKKGYLTTLDAVRLALPDCPNLRLTLAGEPHDPVLTRQVREFIRQHRMEHCVTWLDPIDHRQMPAFLMQFDVFIHPSQRTPDGDHEAVCVVLLEAQATGLPVLATRHYDIPDEVQHTHTGFLVEEGDAPALADAIRTLYRMDNEPYQILSRNARAWVKQTFDVRQSARQLRAIYTAIGTQTAQLKTQNSKLKT
ncbi:MAG: glycosyltransferase family 4 protein [Lewinellaceae bacterium]|nr:glycosyltransferase family 4 protein [Lewinellaceae bacterium]